MCDLSSGKNDVIFWSTWFFRARLQVVGEAALAFGCLGKVAQPSARTPVFVYLFCVLRKSKTFTFLFIVYCSTSLIVLNKIPKATTYSTLRINI